MKSNSSIPFVFGTIDSGYSSGKPKVLFDGETLVSAKAYAFLAGYSPAPNDKVILAKIPSETTGSYTYVILGKINRAVASSSGNPTGTILIWSTNTAPTGYLICDGSAVSRSTYATLYGVVGTTYGTGNGSTTFNLPNLKSKVAVGRDSSQTEFNVLGETGGEKTHTLTIAEMPAHTHDIASQTDTGPDGGTGSLASEDATNLTIEDGALSRGGNGSHNNLQPYIVLNYIIKI